MTTEAFNPTTWTLDPPHRPDYLAGAVLNSLSRPLIGYRRKPWGVVKSFVLGGLSFGLLPLLIWPRRFRDFVIVEQQQLWHLAEWMRVRTGRPEAVELRDVWAKKLEPRHALWVLPTMAAAAVLVTRMLFLAGPGLFDTTYGFWRYADGWYVSPDARFLWREWTLLLSAGYFLHWVQVCKHTGSLVDFTRRFNALTAKEGIPPVPVRGVGLGFHPLWAVAALVGLCNSAAWAVPAALAGVVNARYVWKTSREVRGEFAQRVRTMLLTQRPTLDVPLPVKLLSPELLGFACVNEKCRAPLPPAQPSARGAARGSGEGSCELEVTSCERIPMHLPALATHNS